LALGAGGRAAAAAGTLAVQLMLHNARYLYAGLLSTDRPLDHTVRSLFITNMPAILVVSLPVAALFLGLGAVVGLARGTSPAGLLANVRRCCLATIATSALLAVLGFVVDEAAVPPANRAAVDLVRQELLHEGPSTERRSPQELDLREVLARLPGDTADQALEDRMAVGVKLALPASIATTTLLGLALGFLAVRRRWPAALVGAGGFVAWFVSLEAMSPTRHVLGPTATALAVMLFPLALAAVALVASRTPRT
jgi:hypothetical protein